MKNKSGLSIHGCLLPVVAISLLSFLSGCRLYKANSKTAFLGDSLTEGWRYPEANFGIFGNTTAQMLGRFPDDIPGHRYKQVVILGGTNDVLLGVNPAVTIQHLQELGDQTIQAGAQPLLCEIPPIFHSFDKSNTKNYSQPVRLLNARIVNLAARRHWRLVDYYDPILGHPTYSSDGVHMKRRGYLVMEFALLRAEWTKK